jgi:hypothetical protein
MYTIMFSSVVNNVNATGATLKSSSASVNKAMNFREFYVPEVPEGGPGFNVAPGAVKVPTATTKKNKFP